MAIGKEKSRTERRKEARLDKKKMKFDSWIQHQQYHKQKKSSPPSLSNHPTKSKDDKLFQKNLGSETYHSLEQHTAKNSWSKLDSDSSAFKHVVQNKDIKNSKGKSEEHLEMGMLPGFPSREEDLEVERKLAKKLKVKNGKFRGLDDDLNILIGETTSMVDFEEVSPASEEEQKKNSERSSLSKKLKKNLLLEKEAEGSNRKKTKFEKYLEMEMQEGVASAEADLYMERKLAKKLKVKEGKLRGDDDDINSILEGIPSVLDFFGNEENFDDSCIRKSSENKSSSKKNKKMKTSKKKLEAEMASKTIETFSPEKVPDEISAKSSEVEEGAKYVAPHLRSRARNESMENAQIRRRIRGLLNRLSEANVESITGEMSSIFNSVARSVSSQIIIEEILASCAGGPRGNEQYAAVFAAFVAGMASLVGIDFGAKLLDSLAKCFEEESRKEDNLSLRNLTLLLSYLYLFGVCSSDLIYDFMIVLSKRLMEADVSTILTVLQCCGMNLRGDDPVAMKNFVLSVQNRANELKASSESGRPNTFSKRMDFMLQTICDIKNNKKRAREDTPNHTRIKKWLQKLRAKDILVRGLKWSKLLDPNKKGQWWLSADLASSTTSHVEEVVSTIDLESLEAQKLLQLAAAQRMNTDIRRAIFCIIMSSEDYVDAFEKLIRLDLQGKQDREIMRVLLECCLQEKVFNKYYFVLATKFCKHDNKNVTTLKYCLWDHFKELESMGLVRLRNLSKFVAEMIASFTLSLSVLKVVNLSDTVQMTGKVIMHFRMLFETLLERPDSVIWNAFTRVAADPDLESFRNSVELFINSYIVSSDKSLSQKFKVAKKALANVKGILM